MKQSVLSKQKRLGAIRDVVSRHVSPSKRDLLLKPLQISKMGHSGINTAGTSSPVTKVVVPNEHKLLALDSFSLPPKGSVHMDVPETIPMIETFREVIVMPEDNKAVLAGVSRDVESNMTNLKGARL